MQIIVPMSGQGQRFINAGYTLPKPLIPMNGRPMIAHVIDCFSKEDQFVFICNQRHLETTDMRKILEELAPECKIVGIPEHKLGPVYAVAQAYHEIEDKNEVIINYCDFGKYWNYREFLEYTRLRKADGAISVYRGFHPHMLGTTNYAFCREENRYLLEIREKQPFTEDRMQEYASDGTYYFRSGKILKHYFDLLMQRKIATKGEYYVSMVYNLLVEDGLKVSLFEIEHMLQWGTPEDVFEYNAFSDTFDRMSKTQLAANEPVRKGTLLIPMAGAGSRFAKEGYTLPKPLIEVGSKPMIVQAIRSLPNYENQVLICKTEHLKDYPLQKTLHEHWPKAKLIAIEKLTEGQACTCEIGLPYCDNDAPLFVGACDNALLFDVAKLDEITSDLSVKAVILTFRNHPGAIKNPNAYGWVKADESGRVQKVLVKEPISENPACDPAIVGAFWFRNPDIFREGLACLYQKEIRVNNEFYVDSLAGVLAEIGHTVCILDVTDYLCFGTPNELKTFNYWQRFFSKVTWHPYEMFHHCPLL